MKNKLKLLAAFALLSIGFANAQVGIGTTTPAAGAALDITSTNKGLLLPRVANTAAITNPVDGMMVYDILSKCIRNYENGAWSGCSSFTAANVPTVTSATGKIWMDRNLGATRVAQSVNDYLAYGDLYQWGRKADGHEKITWTSATTGTPVNGPTTAKADVPANALFITEDASSDDWRVNPDDNLWTGVAAVNNPCPAGYRVPTTPEMTAEVNAYNITNIATAFTNPLKFTAAGLREPDTIAGALEAQGTYGCYWTTNTDFGSAVSRAYYPSFTRDDANFSRSYGISVRCLKD